MKPVFTVSLNGQLDQISILEYNKSIIDLFEANKEPFTLLLEMSGVDYMNSTAIGHIADWYNTLSEKGGETVIIGAKDNIKDTLEIVGLANRISLYDSIEQFKIAYIQNNVTN